MKHLHLLKNDSLSHSGSSKDISLNRRDVVSLLVSLDDKTVFKNQSPYRPISRYDEPHEVYEQHEYHKVF